MPTSTDRKLCGPLLLRRLPLLLALAARDMGRTEMKRR
jgi:hypothetical protein